MKFCLLFFSIALVSTQSFAAKTYSLNDYRNYTKDGAVKVTVPSSSRTELNYYGKNCGFAALASVIAKSFSIAEENGVDYPEIIEINNVRVSSPTNWIYQLQLTSGKYIFTTTLTTNLSQCSASEATVSPRVTNLGSLRVVR